jgi:TetR/AcrR family transcriptional regulator, transcriptional repressor for nem operon
MTDSPIDQRHGKRERLVEGACRVVHEHGVEGTTLADIAGVADVPVGNVYYYFKTKDELIEAVIDAHVEDIRARLADFERHRTPRARLKALTAMWSDLAELVARDGCPHGTLCAELNKRDEGLDRTAAQLMELSVDWAEQQFAQMGRRDSRDLAVELIARFQGTALLTNTFRDPGLMTRQSRRTDRWIDSLA